MPPPSPRAVPHPHHLRAEYLVEPESTQDAGRGVRAACTPPDAPEHADQRGGTDPTRAGDDGGDGDHCDRDRRVPYAEEEAEEKDRRGRPPKVFLATGANSASSASLPIAPRECSTNRGIWLSVSSLNWTASANKIAMIRGASGTWARFRGEGRSSLRVSISAPF